MARGFPTGWTARGRGWRPLPGLTAAAKGANKGRANFPKGPAMSQSRLPFWQRLLITVLVMLGASYVAALLWNAVLGFALPSYLAGLVGGLAALPVWDLLQRIRPKG